MDANVTRLLWLSNGSVVIGDSGLYMSPFEAVVATVVWLIIALTAAIGNIMVVVAIFTHPALYIVQNFLLVSLAVADILVALLVMPFVITTTLLNEWIFGQTWCLFHVTCDVLLCTASILHLVAIALDRFFAIHCPIKYAQTRNLSLVLEMIAAAWIVSALISIPPLIGWNDMDADPSQCGYVQNTGYIIYSALGSFYIPLIILVTVYLTIFISARRRLRRRAKATSPYSAVSVVMTPQAARKPKFSFRPKHRESSYSQNAHAEAASFDSPDKSDAGSVLSNPLTAMTAAQIRCSVAAEHRRLHRKLLIFPMQKNCALCRRTQNKLLKENCLATSSFQIIQEDDYSTCSPIVDLTHMEHQQLECLVSLNPNGSNSSFQKAAAAAASNGSANKMLNVPVSTAVRPKALTAAKSKVANGSNVNHVSEDVKQSLAKRQKISLTRERRAARTLLIVVLVFVICWFPFFLWYVVKPFCPDCPMDMRTYNFMLWLGFLNSSLNPVIYTIFNLDFRKAFKRIFQKMFPSYKCFKN